MAGKLIEAAMRVPGLTPYERCVLAKLADRANIETKLCWPSVELIAKDTESNLTAPSSNRGL